MPLIASIAVVCVISGFKALGVVEHAYVFCLIGLISLLFRILKDSRHFQSLGYVERHETNSVPKVTFNFKFGTGTFYLTAVSALNVIVGGYGAMALLRFAMREAPHLNFIAMFAGAFCLATGWYLRGFIVPVLRRRYSDGILLNGYLIILVVVTSILYFLALKSDAVQIIGVVFITSVVFYISRYGVTGIAINRLLDSQSKNANSATTLSLANIPGFSLTALYSGWMILGNGAPTPEELLLHVLVVSLVSALVSGLLSNWESLNTTL